MSGNRLNDRRRFLLLRVLLHLDFLEGEIETLNSEIRSRLKADQFKDGYASLQSTPGIKEDAAAAILAGWDPI